MSSKEKEDSLTEEEKEVTLIEQEEKTETNGDSEQSTNDTVIDLQLGDVIHITNPTNETLNDQLFSIDYIDR